MTYLYETEALQAVAGRTLRPGGLALTERAMDFCRLPAGALVMDVGCGRGATVDWLRQNHGLRAVGLDLSWKLLVQGRRTSAAPLVIGRAEALPVCAGNLAAVFSECVLSVLTDPVLALAEWSRVLAPGGYLILSDLYDRTDWSQNENLTPHSCLQGAIGRATLFEHLAAADLAVLLFEDHTPLLRQLAAQLAWTHGSLARFWEMTGMAALSCADSKVSRRAPGYCLMVARKGGAGRG
jgi:SAM-dependent methyltransferase